MESLDEVVRQSLAPDGNRHWPRQWRTGKPGTERIYSNDAFSLAGLALQSVVHAGCAHTTAQDFAQLALMLVNGGSVNGVQILDPTSTKLVLSPSGFRNLDGWSQGVGLNGPLGLRGTGP